MIVPISKTPGNGAGHTGMNQRRIARRIEVASPQSVAPAAPICHEIYVYGIDSHVSRFVVSDPQAARSLLERVHPSRIFSQRNLVLTGDSATTIFPSAGVVRIDFVTEGYPDWSFPHHESDMVEITETEMRARLGSEARSVRFADSLTAGGRHLLFADIILANAERIFVQCELRGQEPTELRSGDMVPLDHSLMAQHILAESSLYIRRQRGGAILLNSAHVVRINLHSGPTEIPSAWPANLV